MHNFLKHSSSEWMRESGVQWMEAARDRIKTFFHSFDDDIFLVDFGVLFRNTYLHNKFCQLLHAVPYAWAFIVFIQTLALSPSFPASSFYSALYLYTHNMWTSIETFFQLLLACLRLLLQLEKQTLQKLVGFFSLRKRTVRSGGKISLAFSVCTKKATTAAAHYH